MSTSLNYNMNKKKNELIKNSATEIFKQQQLYPKGGVVVYSHGLISTWQAFKIKTGRWQHA